MDAQTKGIRAEEKMKAKRNTHTGSSFSAFLADEGLETEVSARAAKRTFIYQLEKQMNRRHAKKNVLRRFFGSPTTTQRVFDEGYTALSLDTMTRAASAVGCDLQIALVPKKIAK